MRAKWLLAVFACVSTVCSGAAIAQQCSHTRGSWTDVYGYVWSISQDGGGSLSGVVYTPCWSSPTWGVGGTYNASNGAASLEATNPFPDENCNSSFTYTGQLDEGGCNTGGGSWINDYNDTGAWTWGKSCEVPSGEYTDNTVTWSAAHTIFTAHVNDTSGGNLSGRWYRETDYSSGTDGCYQSGDATTPWGGVDGTTAYLDGTDNNHYQDEIGWSAYDVGYYRALGRAPCSHNAFQRELIACAAGLSWSPVQSQVLVSTIGTTTVTNSRGSVSKTITY